MSHFSKINATISDEEALKAATEKMGFSMVIGGKCRYYYGSEAADIVVKLPGKYDVALDKNGESYNVKADLFEGEVENYIGKGAGFLLQRYSAEKARIEAFKRSLAVTEEEKDGDIVLHLIDPDTGGQIEIICRVGGKIDLQTNGFPGQTCMKFQDFENALGKREDFAPTMEMYQEEPVTDTEHIYTS